jgi:cholesterol oxidase
MTTGLEFTEEMKGHITLGETDYQRGARQGKKDGTFFMFHLTIETDDVAKFIADRQHEATCRGWVSCEALGGKLPVEKGIFNLFVDTEDPDLTRMLYRLYFADGAGNPLTMSGFKRVKDDPGLDLWPDTSTLYIHLLKGHVDAQAEPTAEVVAAGIITIYLLDFARQLTTFRTRGGSAGEQAQALTAFGRLFLGKLWDIYGGRVKDSAATEA